MAKETQALGDRFHLGKRLGFFRKKIAEGLVEQGMTEEQAHDTVGKIGDGTLLELLIKYGPDIMKLVMMIISLFPK